MQISQSVKLEYTAVHGFLLNVMTHVCAPLKTVQWCQVQ